MVKKKRCRIRVFALNRMYHSGVTTKQLSSLLFTQLKAKPFRLPRIWTGGPEWGGPVVLHMGAMATIFLFVRPVGACC